MSSIRGATKNFNTVYVVVLNDSLYIYIPFPKLLDISLSYFERVYALKSMELTNHSRDIRVWHFLFFAIRKSNLGEKEYDKIGKVSCWYARRR